MKLDKTDDLKDVCSTCDWIVSGFSTAGLECLALGKPVFSIRNRVDPGFVPEKVKSYPSWSVPLALNKLEEFESKSASKKMSISQKKARKLTGHVSPENYLNEIAKHIVNVKPHNEEKKLVKPKKNITNLYGRSEGLLTIMFYTKQKAKKCMLKFFL